MKNINVKHVILFLMLVLEIGASMAQQSISEDMLNMLRKQGVNIDGPVPSMNATKFINSGINIDCSVTRGPFLHTEKYNNFSHSKAFVDQRSDDVEFFNKIGLHGKIYRVWLEGNRFYNASTGEIEFHEMPDYLKDASAVSDYLLVNCGHMGIHTEWNLPLEKSVDRLAKILSALKRQFPKIKYIEATNEPDYANEGLTPDNYYDVYKVYYMAVNKVNEALKPAVPLLVGGPSTAQFSLAWLRGFLDSYVKDAAADKRIDFISYHGYFTRPDSAYILFRDNPSLVKDQRSLLNKELVARNLRTDIPVFITEMGLYPGPSFDDYSTMKYDHLRQAAGMSSLFYWYMESENTYPFNWVFRHQTEGRKDQLISRDEKGGPFVQTNKLTPYGNMMLMMSKMKMERLPVSTFTSITEGKGLYVLASKDDSGVSIMIWNYQSKSTEGYKVELRLDNLPMPLRNENVTITAYSIDQTTSNFHTNLKKSNLQLIKNTVSKLKASYTSNLTLDPNALYLLVLEPKKIIKKTKQIKG